MPWTQREEEHAARMRDDEQKRTQIREWLAQLEPGERVRIIQLFASLFGVEVPAGMVLKSKRPSGLEPPREQVKTTAMGKVEY